MAKLQEFQCGVMLQQLAEGFGTIEADFVVEKIQEADAFVVFKALSNCLGSGHANVVLANVNNFNDVVHREYLS